MPAKPIKLIKVGSRKSQLALIQTELVIGHLKKTNPDTNFEIVSMSTTGDNNLAVALSKIGEKALFTKELEMALESKEVDFVVHSLKDLPTSLPDGMVIGAVLEREDPRDAVVLKAGSQAASLSDLKAGSIVGTSSLRRAAQLKAKHPGLEFQDVRGNLNTRLRKLDDEEGKYSALILAAAGITRMGWSDRISEFLESDSCMHAVGQGALGVECRQDDTDTLELLAVLHHRETVLATIAERAFMKTLEGGCSVPVAVTSSVSSSGVTLNGGVWSLDGSKSLKGEKTTSFSDNHSASKRRKSDVDTFAAIKADNFDQDELRSAELVGRTLAEELLSQGAKSILQEAKSLNDKK